MQEKKPLLTMLIPYRTKRCLNTPLFSSQLDPFSSPFLARAAPRYHVVDAEPVRIRRRSPVLAQWRLHALCGCT